MIFTATVVPFHVALNTCRNAGEEGLHSVFKRLHLNGHQLKRKEAANASPTKTTFESSTKKAMA
jgi:hypothetical protein